MPPQKDFFNRGKPKGEIKMNDNQKTGTGVSGKIMKRDVFATKFGIIAAAAGSAIGLGNIWKFPYITGIYGGAAFIFVYLICILLIGLPVMLSEFAIGRSAQKNAVGSFKVLAPKKKWYIVGVMGVAAAFIILSFYGVVAGWTIDYIVQSAANGFAGKSPGDLENMFTQFISKPFFPLLWQSLFMITTALILVGGVSKGIEKYTKILMPLLLVIIIILDIRAVTLEGAEKGLEFLFKPDFSKLTGDAILNALGHAFFSLSLGMGTLITYGSYIGKKENIGTMAAQVTILDTLIALMAGVAIFPAVFAFGIEPGAGPGLVFITLPNVFQQMPGGYIFSILFFFLLFVAALTSSISILEVVVAYFSEEMKMSRKKAIVVSATAITIVGIFCSFSMGIMSDFKIFGLNFFDLLDYIASNIFLPLGGLFIIIYVGWFFGRDKFMDEITNKGEVKAPYFKAFMFLAKFVVPVAIAIIFLHGIGALGNLGK
jgi:NSS family neurotransmitter:Na+ symporter